jgi:hypothetical protein
MKAKPSKTNTEPGISIFSGISSKKSLANIRPDTGTMREYDDTMDSPFLVIIFVQIP